MDQKAQDCVGQHISKFMDEGIPQKQAIAKAMSMCGESAPKKKDFQAFEQAEVNYTPYQNSANGCGNCRFFISNFYNDEMPDQDACQIVQAYPDPMLPTGLCNQWAARKDNQSSEMAAEIGDAAETAAEAVLEGAASAKSQQAKGLFARLFKALNGKPDILPETGFKVLPDGQWIAWWTNNFEDREGELFTEKAIAQYIESVKSGEIPYPELWFYHIFGTKHGEATHLWQLGHFAVASGTFEDSAEADAFKSYYAQKSDQLGVSHGYLYPADALVDGAYHAFTTFEISPLPKSKAANSVTSFERIKAMQITDDQKQELIAVLGEDMAGSVLAAAEEHGKALEETGKRFKATSVQDEEARAGIAQLAEQVKALTEQVQTLTETMPSSAEGAEEPVEEETPAEDPEPDVTNPENETLKALAEQVKGLSETLAEALGQSVPASRAKETQLPDQDSVVAWLTEQEAKQAKSGQSLVEALSTGIPIPIPNNGNNG